jgi:hypothetical protein
MKRWLIVLGIGWWLMLAPPDHHGGLQTNAPLSQWIDVFKFSTLSDCRSFEQAFGQDVFVYSNQFVLNLADSQRCVRSDDPELNPDLRGS